MINESLRLPLIFNGDKIGREIEENYKCILTLCYVSVLVHFNDAFEEEILVLVNGVWEDVRDYFFFHSSFLALVFLSVYQACCLGSVGFASLMINAALAQFWASSQHYLRSYHWACAELSVRGLTATFLMVMFLHVNARALPLNNPDVKINHFLVPALMLGVMANCAACLVDQYFGPLDKRIRYVISYVKPMWSVLCVNSCIIFDKISLLEKKNCVVPDLFFSFQCHGFNGLQSYDTQ